MAGHSVWAAAKAFEKVGGSIERITKSTDATMLAQREYAVALMQEISKLDRSHHDEMLELVRLSAAAEKEALRTSWLDGALQELQEKLQISRDKAVEVMRDRARATYGE